MKRDARVYRSPFSPPAARTSPLSDGRERCFATCTQRHGQPLPSTATARVASQFRVHCLEKPKEAVSDGDALVPLLESALPSPAPKPDLAAPLSYLDVVQQLDGGGEWSFSPYPPCTRSQLLQVHAYWVAIPRASTAATPRAIEQKPSDGASAAHEGEESASTRSSEEETTAPRCSCGGDGENAVSARPSACGCQFACVVGVVWVRLSAGSSSLCSSANHRALQSGHSGTGSATGALSNIGMHRPSVEGYIQVVLTHPDYRRRGLASWLLTQCLSCTEAPAGVFAPDRGDGVAYVIQRWRLHTLAATRRKAKRSRDGGDATRALPQNCAQPPHRFHSADSCESARVCSEAMIAATLAMYRRLGFQERRYLARYYAGKDDAVELVQMR
ncbi:hypothetical protein LSCM4_02053 [Leishmania orientalis]|uniref:N-acetyltransferase domain-containing protein n=1 Tax=Leishmania orientalis TaxID=2249476 RepID=A0A836KJA7_9TRYP|nr:hypothetical protein LSCM4_02053 [Leishmania orientalis]